VQALKTALSELLSYTQKAAVPVPGPRGAAPGAYGGETPRYGTVRTAVTAAMVASPTPCRFKRSPLSGLA